MEAHERAALIHACTLAMSPTVAQLNTIRRDLDKAAVLVLLAMPIEAVRRLPPALVEEAATLIEDSANPAELGKLSKKWEAGRPLDDTLKKRIRRDLAALVRGQRGVYSQPTYISAQVARTQPEVDRAALREAIEDLAPTSHLKALLTKWDPKRKPMPKTRPELKAALLELLDGAASSGVVTMAGRAARTT